MSDDDIIARGGTEEDIRSYAESNGATDPIGSRTKQEELRVATKRSIALLVAQRRGADRWDEQDFITAGNILFVANRLIRETVEAEATRRELAHFERMRAYYGRGNLKLWEEPDNNHNPVYLDDHIAELRQALSKEVM